MVIPVWQTSTSKLRQCFVLTLLSCVSHTDVSRPSAFSVISATTTTLLPLLPLLQLYCHCCKACHSTATAAKPATLLPCSHPDCISPCVLRPLCARNDLRLLIYSPLHTSYASTIILATTIILAIVLFNQAKCNRACATCHCGIKPMARNCYVVFPIVLFSHDIATKLAHYSAQQQLTTTRLLCRMPSSSSYLRQS